MMASTTCSLLPARSLLNFLFFNHLDCDGPCFLNLFLLGASAKLQVNHYLPPSLPFFLHMLLESKNSEWHITYLRHFIQWQRIHGALAWSLIPSPWWLGGLFCCHCLCSLVSIVYLLGILEMKRMLNSPLAQPLALKSPACLLSVCLHRMVLLPLTSYYVPVFHSCLRKETQPAQLWCLFFQYLSSGDMGSHPIIAVDHLDISQFISLSFLLLIYKLG